MHDFNDMIEKYRHELLEFSKQMPLPQERDFEQVMAKNVQPTEESPQEDEVKDHIIIKPYSDYEDFVERNGSSGKLRVQVFAADRSFPISGANVTVSVPFLIGSKELFRGKTDADGIIDNITLPAPNKALSLDEGNTLEPFALYNVKVTHPDYADGDYASIPVFDSVKSIQPVELVPLTQSGNEPRETVFGGEDGA